MPLVFLFHSPVSDFLYARLEALRASRASAALRHMSSAAPLDLERFPAIGLNSTFHSTRVRAAPGGREGRGGFAEAPQS